MQVIVGLWSDRFSVLSTQFPSRYFLRLLCLKPDTDR